MARILVIDDVEEVRSVVRATLEAAGHAVSEAGDGKEGLRRFEQEPAELVITDLVMPGTDGIETLLVLKKKHPEVKIIAMSGLSPFSPVYLKAAAQLGAAGTLAKPFRPNQLVEIVERVLS